MLSRTHFIFALFVYLILFSYLDADISNKFLFLIFLLIATFFVDIDSAKSKIGNRFYLRPLQWIFSHRGFFHTPFAGILFFLIIYYFNAYAGLGFFTGYILHLFLDMLTKEGIALFWPLYDKKIGLGIKSGGLLEEIFFVLLLLADIYLFIIILAR